MKNIKRVFGVVALLAIVASFSVSCGLSRAQDVAYYNFLAGLEVTAEETEIKSEAIKETVKANNKGFKALGFKVEDKKEGSDIAKGTKVKDLKKRFVKKGAK